MNDLSGVLHQLRQELAILWGSKLSAVYLYGSQARGDPQPDSDVGILAVLREDFDYFETLHSADAIVRQLSLENDIIITLSLASEEQLKKQSAFFVPQCPPGRSAGVTGSYWIEKSDENLKAAELLISEGFYAIATTARIMQCSISLKPFLKHAIYPSRNILL